MTKQIYPLLTVADLDSMPEDGNRYELIEGELFVSRAPSLEHQRISTNLVTDINNYLRQNPIGEVWATPGVILTDFNGVIPDIVYVSNARLNEIAGGERLTGAPDLVVEVLSPGAENIKRDRVAKRQIYGKYGVQEYWIVDAESRSVEIYRLRKKRLDLVATLTERDEITSPLLSGFSCRVGSLF